MVITVSNEQFLEYLLNNANFVGDPEVVVKGQMFSLINIDDEAPIAGAMKFTLSVDEGQIFTMPTPDGYDYNYNIFWGDGVFESVTSESASHQYVAAGIYTVQIVGICEAFVFYADNPNRLMLQSVASLGDLTFLALKLNGCENMTSFVSGTDCDTSGVFSFSICFSGCYTLAVCDLAGVSNAGSSIVTGMFRFCSVLPTINMPLFDWSLYTDLDNVFNDCPELTDSAPEWWDNPQYTSFNNCFGDNTSRPNYDDIPASWKGGVLGDELILDVGFDTPANWVAETGWDISGSAANCDGSTPDASVYQVDPLPLLPNTEYEATYTPIQTSGAGLRMEYVSDGNFEIVNDSQDGFRRFNFTTLSIVDDGIMYITNGTDWVGSIEDWSVKEVIGFAEPFI